MSSDPTKDTSRTCGDLVSHPGSRSMLRSGALFRRLDIGATSLILLFTPPISWRLLQRCLIGIDTPRAAKRNPRHQPLLDERQESIQPGIRTHRPLPESAVWLCFSDQQRPRSCIPQKERANHAKLCRSNKKNLPNLRCPSDLLLSCKKALTCLLD